MKIGQVPRVTSRSKQTSKIRMNGGTPKSLTQNSILTGFHLITEGFYAEVASLEIGDFCSRDWEFLKSGHLRKPRDFSGIGIFSWDEISFTFWLIERLFQNLAQPYSNNLGHPIALGAVGAPRAVSKISIETRQIKLILF